MVVVWNVSFGIKFMGVRKYIFVSMIVVNFVVDMRWDGWKIRFDGGVKMFNLITLILGLDESMGEIRDFDLHLVTMWIYLTLEQWL